nr:shikimate kinase 3, chloroplastic-like [Physcomitrium patens]|eukprot:XP_024387006.1 shikimate kinase 3, chloroplastic-like [Physcomitrella patens]
MVDYSWVWSLEIVCGSFWVVCKDRRDDSPSGDGNEHYEQFLRQLQKTIDVVLEILDGSSVIVTGVHVFSSPVLETLDDLGNFSSDELIGDLMDYGTVADIFAKYGEEWFRKSETEALLRLREQIKEVHEPFVVALGGGAMLRPENWVFQDCGIVVYIDVPPVVLAKRVVGAGVQSRPLFPPECTELEVPAFRGFLHVLGLFCFITAFGHIRAYLSRKLGISDASAIPPALVALEILKAIEKYHKST